MKFRHHRNYISTSSSMLLVITTIILLLSIAFFLLSSNPLVIAEQNGEDGNDLLDKGDVADIFDFGTGIFAQFSLLYH